MNLNESLISSHHSLVQTDGGLSESVSESLSLQFV